MAQLAEQKSETVDRARRLVRQRPVLALAMTLSMGLLTGVAAFGVVTAQGAGGVTGGLEIERDVEALPDETGDKDSRGEASVGAKKKQARSKESIVVDVSGAVASPTVVELPDGSRVQDAIEAAGGLATDADISTLNRAVVCSDGQKVYVPRQGEAPVVATGSQPSDASAGGAGSSLVNINTADVTALETLSGVGPSTAQAIVKDREANGPFSSVEDLMRVSGIGEKKFEKLKDGICV